MIIGIESSFTVGDREFSGGDIRVWVDGKPVPECVSVASLELK
jgi:hypothetical protein